MLFRFFPLLILLNACSPKSTGQSTQHGAVAGSTKSLKPITKVLAAHTNAWMNIPGVEGTGATRKNGKPAILIFVDSLTESLRSQLPSNVEGYPVVIQTVGEIRALPKQ